MFDFERIATDWEKESKLYNDLGTDVSNFIRKEITSYEILPEITFRTKELLSVVKKIQKNIKTNPNYSLIDLKDKLGFRIICAFSSDLEIVDRFIIENFIIKKTDYKKDLLDYDKLDYTSNHYDAKINIKNKKGTFNEKYENLVFEIQVRSINQHAWANSAHILTYKREASISEILKRRVYRLLSLYEIADDEFSSVNNILSRQENNIVYSIIRKLESKIYKYAGVDFDRDTSIFYLGIIMGSFETKEVDAINNAIIDFISINSEKISNIFTLNKPRFYKIPYITQPEIFIVWYCLENYLFKIEEIYTNNFDDDELEQIKAIWG